RLSNSLGGPAKNTDSTTSQSSPAAKPASHTTSDVRERKTPTKMETWSISRTLLDAAGRDKAPALERQQRVRLDLAGLHVFGHDVAIGRGHRSEGAPVVDRGPESRERSEMLGHAVTLVLLETVAGIEQSQPRHEPIARDLGHDRGSGDRGQDRIAADHGFAVAAGIDAVAAIDEHELRLDRQACDGARERP